MRKRKHEAGKRVLLADNLTPPPVAVAQRPIVTSADNDGPSVLSDGWPDGYAWLGLTKRSLLLR